MLGSQGTQAVLWSSKHLEFSQTLGFLADGSIGYKANNFKIVWEAFGATPAPPENAGRIAGPLLWPQSSLTFTALWA